jgi:5-methyltetrahydrofolate--homocysteine methyltransferase
VVHQTAGFDELRAALLAYDETAVARTARRLVDSGADAREGLDCLAATIREVGDRFESGEVFLPELMLAADAMAAGAAILTSALPAGSRRARGTVVIGVVRGDIHDIGKMIVGSMLAAAGFRVVDIGADAAPAAFAEAADKNDADIIALSALLTTTLPVQREVIEYFDALGVRARYKVIVGGAPCTARFAEEIGADGYAGDGAEAARIAIDLLGDVP